MIGALLIEFPTARVLVQNAALFAPGWNTLVLAGVAWIVLRKLYIREAPPGPPLLVEGPPEPSEPPPKKEYGKGRRKKKRH